MNAKGIKFLAVLAVLAMAFAAFAVISDTNQNDATAADVTASDFIAGKENVITVKAGTGDDAGYTVITLLTDINVTEAITISSGKYIIRGDYEVTTTLTSGTIVTVSGQNTQVVFDGPSITSSSMKVAAIKGTASAYIASGENVVIKKGTFKNTAETNTVYWPLIWMTGKSTFAMSGGVVETVHGSAVVEPTDISKYYTGAGNNGWQNYTTGLFLGSETKNTISGGKISELWVNFNSSGNPDAKTEFTGKVEVGTMWLEYDTGAQTNTVGANGELTITKELVISREVTKTDDNYATTANVCSMTVSGNLIVAEGANIDVQGDLKTVAGGKVTNNGTITNKGSITNNGEIVNVGTLNNSGAVTGTGSVEIPVGGEVKFLENTEITAGNKFKHTDMYGDEHSFKLGDSSKMVAGMGGFTVNADKGGIRVYGTATLGANTVFTFTGNANLSGLIYTDIPATTTNTADPSNNDDAPTSYTLGIANSQADVKISSFQTAGKGVVTLTNSVLVTEGTSFYIGGALTITEVLKIAEDAVVKSEGAVTVTGSIWNAGRFIAPADNPLDKDDDSKLIRVYMNNVTGTGLFYNGSVVYDGTYEGGVSPLAVAYGAYLDLTGKSTVNLTSGQTSVVNTLYRYNTMTIAAYDSTITLNVEYDNQYPATIELLKKNRSGVEKTDKFATYRGVEWDSRDSAVIQIEAPEEYTVVLAKTVTVTETTEYVTYADPWISGLKITGPNDRNIPISSEGKVKLVYGYKYVIEGTTTTSNYNFGKVIPAIEDINKDSQTEISFTMIRNPIIKTGENATEKVGVIQITEGKADKIVVTLNDPASKIAAGEPILYYTTDGGVSTKTVTKPATANEEISFTVFNNDTVFLKYPAIKFYDISATAAATNPNVTITSVVAADKMSGWEQKLVPTAGSISGAITVNCVLATVVQTFYLDVGDATGKTSTITLSFSDYYQGSGAHGATEALTWKDLEAGDNTVATKTATITTYVGEVYTISWTDVEDVREKMTFKVDGSETVNEYKGEAVNVEEKARVYTLTLDKIEFAKVTNKTTKDVITVSDGEFSVDVKKNETANKAVEAHNTAAREKTTIVTLSLEGQTVVAWTFTVKDVQGAIVKSENYDYTSKDVVGESAAIYLVEGDVIEITSINTIYNQYIVKTQPVEHAQIGDYSRVGHMNDNMFVYYSADDKYTVKGVEVYYEDPENEGFPDLERGVYANAEPKTAADGQKYWAYKMPASNVYLKPIIDSDYAIITYKNYDGTVLQTGEVKKGTMPEYTGATPVKPATATETYRFAGWEPAVVAVTADATYTATFETVAPTSTDVTIFLEKAQNGVKVTLLANDGRFLQDGSIEFTYYYAYELNGKWATGFKTFTAQTGEIDDKSLFQFTVDLSEQERFAETMWIEGTYTSADEAVNAASELIVYQ